MPQDISPLWNQPEGALSSQEDAARDYIAVLEQYKLYVELTDRVSERRLNANRFFLTLNAVLFSAVGVIVGGGTTDAPNWIAVYAVILALLQCLVWFRIVRSYRQIAAAKYAVIAEFEQRLPASPWTRAEWKALGEGKDPRRYRPLGSLEQWVPLIFGLGYVGVFLSSGAIDYHMFDLLR